MEQTFAPRPRRGRPPMTATPTEEAPATATGRRRRSSTGGMHLKLAVPQREGYQRRWFNDVEGRLAEAHELAYDHVTDPDIKSDSPDSRVRRHVGTKANGQPLYAYLMETPIEEYRAGLAEREEQHRAVDQAINEGRDPTGRVQNTYGHSSIEAG